MITSRQIEPCDRDILRNSLAHDDSHAGTDPEFFYAPGSVCNVYEDELGTVLFCRGAKALRLDIQFVFNEDFARNRNMLLNGFPQLEAKAKASGFTELIFFSNSPLLVRFCTQKLGFRAVAGELRKLL
jgi:hypothetical protein